MLSICSVSTWCQGGRQCRIQVEGWLVSNLLDLATYGSKYCSWIHRLTLWPHFHPNGIVLDNLTVDPNHQRRGAGRMLVKWGTAIADQMGIDVR